MPFITTTDAADDNALPRKSQVEELIAVASGAAEDAQAAADAAQATADAALPASAAAADVNVAGTAIAAALAGKLGTSATAADVNVAGTAIAAALGGKLNTSALDTDATMAANSDAKVATQKATRAYVASVLAGVSKNKGPLDCSANPNYPVGLNGDFYRCSVAGKVGGASGIVVEVADLIMCVADNAGGTQASVGASWIVGQANIAGITAAGLAMMQAADDEAQAALLDAFFLGISAQAADVDPAGSAISSALGGKLDTTAQAADVDPAGTDIAAALGGKLDTSARAADVDPAGTDIAAALGGKLPLAGGTMAENAVVNLFTGSKWQQSTPDRGIAGTAGFSIICSAGYEYKFANGFLFILSDGSSTVRKVLYAPVAPTATDDTTLGFTTDTTWEMADGTPYYCLDASTGAAVWSRGQKPVGAYSIGALTGNVTLSLANGGTQYGYMSGNTTFQVPTGTPAECVSEITAIVRWADGAHTLDFHADIQRASDSAATFPKTLTVWKSYIFKLKYMGGAWCLVSLTGGFTEFVD